MIQAAGISAANYYGTGLCAYPDYQCIKVGPGQTWENLFPNEQQRDVVQRLNRSYNYFGPVRSLLFREISRKKPFLTFRHFPC